MKKMYITPAVEMNETMVCQMMALSIQDVAADNSPVLVEEEEAWDIWED